ncbi:MAG TPA: adenylate/guanylate cyclase domain-containing protein [Patescibacteria group bacterium]|nr:adenylate/guanylate cyclase domain-containing protein [Patescibacteria group bacterium]
MSARIRYARIPTDFDGVRVTCLACGFENPVGVKFCGECGTRLASGCPACGFRNPPGMKFCGECGAPQAPTSRPAAAGSVAAGSAGPRPIVRGVPIAAVGASASETTTERRLVSVLFADLVGFTSRSDSTDPEHVREFLASYFDLCREIIERYGGTVEKFIGDAVMAVWGTPVAQEDDAERAVRTALDLVDAVRHLGRQAGDEALELRAGILTGEAAVTIGAVGQGMVAGDMVNTASRLQSVAPPGTVLVGEATKRAASGAIAFEAAGEQLLKGKPAPVPAWRALRVVAERGGQGRSEGIEAPFVGRDDELRLLKDFLHATSRERRVRLLSVTGQGGIGKSRLAWELLKYIDGVSEDIYWHQGRSPSFGEGVTFWALGEMVRRRAGLREDDDDATTRHRIAATLAEFVDDEVERRQIEPALLSLLGVGDAAPGGREELFNAWRTFFERISLKGTTILVFEDLQWADAGLMEFIDHLLEWSIGYPLLVITLARPDLLERRPDWGAGRRNFVALALGPLSDGAMRELLAGLVPGLPAPTVRAILQRADGIPLYAVETIRMLVEDGKLEEADGAYRVIGDLGQLQVPDTLHALIAARLDAVDPADRALIQDGSVLGQSFSVAALAALTGEPEEALEPRLRGLVHREILQLDTDPRSPERGQFGFTQALVREVAYSTLGRRDRRAKHLAAARYYESLGDEEVAGVLATHYVDAYEAAPEGPEGEAVATQARLALRGAADRAVALGAHESAIVHWERARAVTTDLADEAELLEKIALASRNLGRFVAAEAGFRDALERYRQLGDRVGAARASFGLSRSVSSTGRLFDAMPIVETAIAEIADLAPHPVLVELWLELAADHSVLGDQARAIDLCDRALADAERLRLPDLVMEGLQRKGGFYWLMGRPMEGRALSEAALHLAERAGAGPLTARAAFGLSLALIDEDPRAAVELGRRTVEMCRRFGLGPLRLTTLMNTAEVALQVGDWGWLEAELDAVDRNELERSDRTTFDLARAEIASMRGRDVSATVAEIRSQAAASQDPHLAAAMGIGLGLVGLAEGRFEDAIRDTEPAKHDDVNGPFAWFIVGRAASRLHDAGRARAALDGVDAAGSRGAADAVNRDALAASVTALEGRWPAAAAAFADVWRRYRDLRMDVALAASQLDCVAVAPPGDPLAELAGREARAIFEREGAVAYLVDLDKLLADRRAAQGTGTVSVGATGET